MPITLAFDVYGTLINTQGVVAGLERIIGDKAAGFSQAWRDKQLEYSFRRGLMQNYVDFGTCISQALDYTCLHYNIPFSESQKAGLLASYRSLPAFGDVPGGLRRLQEAGFRTLCIFKRHQGCRRKSIGDSGNSSFFPRRGEL